MRPLRQWARCVVLAISTACGTRAVPPVSAAPVAPGPVTTGSLTAASRASDELLVNTAYGLEAEVNLAEMTRHPRGFLYRVIAEGTGAEAGPGRRVRVSYVVRLAEGREVDRADAAHPMRFRIGEGTVIIAFDAALRDMRVGDVWQLVVPPRLGYGARGRGPVPPHAILVMIVKLEGMD